MSELFREGLRRLEQEETRPSAATLRDLGSVIRLIQREAGRAGLNKMSKREINAEVEATRKERAGKAESSTNRARK